MPGNHHCVVAPAWLGDAVMAQSLMRLLKSQDKLIGVVTLPSLAKLFERMPEISVVHHLDAGHGRSALSRRYNLAKQLRGHYQSATVLPNSWKSALVPWLAKIPERTGWLGEQRFGLLNDWRRLDKTRYATMQQRFCALALPANTRLYSQLPQPQLVANKNNRAQWQQRLQLADPNGPLLALCPGAAFGPAKCWPIDHFARLAQKSLQAGWQVMIIGTEREAEKARIIQKHCQGAAIDLTGQTDLGDVIDVLSIADGVVCNDSGLMHVAAALNKPLVAVYGSTSPGFTPPLSDKATCLEVELSCRPCFARTCRYQHYACLSRISVEQVSQIVTSWSLHATPA